MKTAILYGPDDVRIEDVPVPEIGPGEVLLRIDTALTCGTDLKVYRRGGHPRMITPPAPFGHEFAGVIQETGTGVEYFQKGMKAVAANSAPCGECFYCRRSLENLCEDLLFINGAYAEYIRIPERIVRKNLFRIPEHLGFAAAALVEPLSCVLHGAEEAGIRPADTVVINGAGPVGLLFIQAARLMGARVIAFDTDESRIVLAREAGADAAIAAEGGALKPGEAVMGLTGGKGADVAVDATGIPAVWEDSAGMVRKGGTVVLFGGCAPGTEFTLDTCHVHYSEITLKGVFHHRPRFVEKSLELLAREAVDPGPVITREMKLEELGRALSLMREKQASKIAIRP